MTFWQMRMYEIGRSRSSSFQKCIFVILNQHQQPSQYSHVCLSVSLSIRLSVLLYKNLDIRDYKSQSFHIWKIKMCNNCERVKFVLYIEIDEIRIPSVILLLDSLFSVNTVTINSQMMPENLLAIG